RELGIESLCLSLRETLQDPSLDRHQPASLLHTDARGGHRERRREDRARSEAGERSQHGHREQRQRERSRDRRREQDKDAADPEVKPQREVPDVKIVCIMRVPKPDVSRLVRMYPEELTVDRNGDARTRFRRLHGADICVEISGFEGVQG
ncbi:hypothetical protein N0V94_003414, partial [Neodidymelliopsis sp. IMI 364377]